MLNCVICEEKKAIADEVAGMLRLSLHEKGVQGDISIYTDSRLFLSDVMEYRPLDLAVIEIEMPHFDGFQIAAQVKSCFPKCCIIFLASSIKFAIKSHELQAFRYVLKCEMNVKLPKYFSDALQFLNLYDNCTYTIFKNRSFERLPYNQIHYIRKDGKYSVITCVDRREIRIRKPLKEILDEIDRSNFLLIDRGCIVNIMSIIRVSDGEAICKNGDRLPISRAKMKETKTRIAESWGMELCM